MIAWGLLGFSSSCAGKQLFYFFSLWNNFVEVGSCAKRGSRKGFEVLIKM